MSARVEPRRVTLRWQKAYRVVAAKHPPVNVFEGMVVEPIFDLRGGRRLPLPPSFDHYDGFLQGAGALEAGYGEARILG